MDYSVHMDHNRHCLLQYRDTGKVRHYVAIVDGCVDCIQLGQKDYKGLKPYIKQTPEHFAEVYLKSHLSVSRSARAILVGVLGGSEPENSNPSAPRFGSGVVDIQGICEVFGWNPSKARKFLRRTMEKPSGRWVFTTEEAENITQMLKEFFGNDSAT